MYYAVVVSKEASKHQQRCINGYQHGKDQAQDQIERILDRIHSLDDLSANDITELRRISEHSLVLDKFKISPTEYRNWLDTVGNDIRGVEYDAQKACLVLKERPGWMHGTAAGIVYGLLFSLQYRLESTTGIRYLSTGSIVCSLDNKFSGSTKQADASLRGLYSKWPIIVLEVNTCDSTRKLFEDARRWLEGSDGNTKLVILVDVQEKERRSTSTDSWGLSELDFPKISHRRLSEHITQWYQSRRIRLVGNFALSVHLWYSDGNRQCILNKAVFAPGNLIDLATIKDIPLRLSGLMPGREHLDRDEPLFFPLRELVNTLQNGFEDVEIQRASDLAENKKKKYLRS
ncbi:hypothetical protein UA08_09025 [Talaromyces atroroseus]|uniref:Uncharacterized protein n=1 Tax=Talaromyces atroroseus TaxID=1441469 RepID=A0A1Q5Q7M2_TALAT|nr:hypothetical protein UA08_09025 [Talaromyces atroroseus]OKL55671.1 hypothetical protein UA08_09025 [Talaromyces atroroseus]